MKYTKPIWAFLTATLLMCSCIFLSGCQNASTKTEQTPPDETPDTSEDETPDTSDNTTVTPPTEDTTITEDTKEDPAADSEETKKNDIEELYPFEVGALDREVGFKEEIPIGEACEIDLNNDGLKDVVYLNVEESDTSPYGKRVESFSINGSDYKYTLFLSDQGIHIQNPDLDSYYITDLNISDSYKEIAILDHGANGIPLTYFIRYVGDGTYCLGNVHRFPSDEQFKINGDGSVDSALELKLLQRWSAPAVWLSGSDQLVSSNLTLRKADLFFPYEKQNVEKVTQIKDIKLYKTNDPKAETIDAKASETASVTFTKTDNEKWVYVKRDDNIEGWMYMENFETIISGTNKYNRRDVFLNLVY